MEIGTTSFLLGQDPWYVDSLGFELIVHPTMMDEEGEIQRLCRKKYLTKAYKRVIAWRLYRPLFLSVVGGSLLIARGWRTILLLGHSSVLLKARIQMSACTMETYGMISCCASPKLMVKFIVVEVGLLVYFGGRQSSPLLEKHPLHHSLFLLDQ